MKLDICWGYYNIHLQKGDKWKAAFKTNHRLFEPMVMFFGLYNSSSTFQNMINNIFCQEIDEGWLEIYMDNILLYSYHLLDHHKRIKQVLQKLQEYNLYLKTEKCEFDQVEVSYLGLMI